MSEITLSTFVLAVRDLETSRRFYINQLGFEEDLAVEVVVPAARRLPAAHRPLPGRHAGVRRR